MRRGEELRDEMCLLSVWQTVSSVRRRGGVMRRGEELTKGQSTYFLEMVLKSGEVYLLKFYGEFGVYWSCTKESNIFSEKKLKSGSRTL